MGKVDRELFRAKYGDDPVEYFKHLPDVESVEVCHDEIIVNYNRDTKHIFPEEICMGDAQKIQQVVQLEYRLSEVD